MCRQSATVCSVSVCLVPSPARRTRLIGPLAARLATLTDPRHRRGKGHPLVCVLLAACSAVVAGARSFAAIGQWRRNAPQEALARLGARILPVLGVRVAPSAATIRRVITLTCPGGLADLLGSEPTGVDTLAVDGKTARGSRTAHTPAAHLLAAMTGTGMTVTQLRVPGKTNDITCFAALPDPYDLAGVTVTADALHTQREHARFLVETKNAHYALTVKHKPAQPVQPATPPALDRSHRPLLRPRPRSRQARDPRDPGPDRHRAGRRLSPRHPGRQDRAAPHHPVHRHTHPRNHLPDHRPDQPPGIPATPRTHHPVTVDHREPPPPCP
jgi:hypothetical protein